MARQNSGHTLAEFLVGMGITAGIMVSLTGVFAFAISWFNRIIERNVAEQNLVDSAYYMKYFMSQAVKSKCCAGANCAGLPAAGYTAIPLGNFAMAVEGGIPPVNVASGVFDCRSENPANWTPGRPNPLALFIREDGGASINSAPASKYVASGIYFEPPVGNKFGALYFMNGTPGGSMTPNPSGLVFDRLVNVGVIPSSILNSPLGRLGSLTLHITARYYVRSVPAAEKTYLPGAMNNGFVDVDLYVPVNLRNNWLGMNPVVANTAERLNGNVYYYRMFSPPIETLQF